MTKLKQFLIDIIKNNHLIWIIVFGIFLVGLIFGIFLPSTAKILFLNTISEKFAQIITPDQWQLFLNIFFNNIFIGIVSILSGFILLPLVFIIFTNALLLGVIGHLGYLYTQLDTSNFALFIITTLPHGILELPIFFFSAFLGFTLLPKLFFTNSYFPQYSRRHFYWNILQTFFIIVLPIFLLAALIEAFITPAVANFYLNKFPDKNQYLAKYFVKEDHLANIELNFVNIDHTEQMISTELPNPIFVPNIKTFFVPSQFNKFKDLALNDHFANYFVNAKAKQLLAIEIYKLNTADEADTFKNNFLDYLINMPFDFELEEIEKHILQIKNHDTNSYVMLKQKNNFVIILQTYNLTLEQTKQVLEIQQTHLP